MGMFFSLLKSSSISYSVFVSGIAIFRFSLINSRFFLISIQMLGFGLFLFTGAHALLMKYRSFELWFFERQC